VRDFAKDWEQAVATAEFRCARCGRLAARVALLLDGSPGDTSGAGLRWLICQRGFYGELWSEVADNWVERLALATAKADARALYAAEPLWAPFYCPECAACYCHDHWQMKVVYDDEWSDWYDYTDGTCPKGHTRMIDD
jgi:hypothetical protein